MADIFHYFLIKALQQKIFEAVSTPRGLDVWWTKRSREPQRVQNMNSGLVLTTIGERWFPYTFRTASLNWGLPRRRKIGRERVWAFTSEKKRALLRCGFTIWVGPRITSIIAFRVTAGRCISDYSNDMSNILKWCRMKTVLMYDDFKSVWF